MRARTTQQTRAMHRQQASAWARSRAWLIARDRGALLLVVLFLLLLPLSTPRIYATDEVQYFAYLRSLYFDGDLDFQNEYQHFAEQGLKNGDPAVFKLEVKVNGEVRQTVRFSELVRSADRLLADVSEFMTLGAGDILMLGCDVGRPRAKVGDRIDITMPALGTLTNTLIAEAAA